MISTTQPLRTSILTERDRLTREQLEAKSRKIAANLHEFGELTDAATIFTYVNFRSEVITTDLIGQLLGQGKCVAVPITRVKEKRLDIIMIKDPEKELVPGYCGIPEPKEELVADRIIVPEKIDTIILPGSVFDTRCGRFGYGGGYYDRLLQRIPAAHRIALAFELQIVEDLPLQSHDEILDYVVTEERTIHNPQRQHRT